MLARVASSVLGVYILYAVAVFALQRRLLFPGQKLVPLAGSAECLAGCAQMQLQTSSEVVEAWFLPPLSEAPAVRKPAVIVAHGNGGIIDDLPAQFNGFRNLGLGVLLVEYPGYGRSDGSPSEPAITEAMVTAYDALVVRADVDPSRIVAYGRSVGGGAACALARRRPTTALILKSTFTSVRAFAAKCLLPSFLVRDPFDHLATVTAYPGPVLILHGAHDDLIPYDHGVALAQAASKGTLVTYACAHNDCPPHWPVFWRDIASFLRAHGIIVSSE